MKTETTTELENKPSPQNDEAQADIKKLTNLHRLRLSQDFAAGTPTKKLLTTVKIRKPGKHDFVRVRSGDEWQFATAMIEVENEFYIVDPSLFDLLTTSFVPWHLSMAIDRQGNIFLWPTRLPGQDGRDNPWWVSARVATEAATSQWVKTSANLFGGCYDVFAAKGDLGEPQWPAVSFDRILEVAFEGRVLDSEDHPIVRKLLGAV